MAPSTASLLLAAGVFTAIAVFVAAFRFALRECAESRDLGPFRPDLPRAAIHPQVSGDRWLRGAGRQRAIASVRLLQAGFVAIGITSVFVMAACMAGIVGLMIFT